MVIVITAVFVSAVILEEPVKGSRSTQAHREEPLWVFVRRTDTLPHWIILKCDFGHEHVTFGLVSVLRSVKQLYAAVSILHVERLRKLGTRDLHVNKSRTCIVVVNRAFILGIEHHAHSFVVPVRVLGEQLQQGLLGFVPGRDYSLSYYVVSVFNFISVKYVHNARAYCSKVKTVFKGLSHIILLS
ncbi:MAG: hypothetical protein J5706_03785 [Elusimicrobiales bacterium]|nr:hypothetical protein [Elusimicrobiales bacterium]